MLAKRGGLDLAQAFAAIQSQLRYELRARDGKPARSQWQLQHPFSPWTWPEGPGVLLIATAASLRTPGAGRAH